MHQPAKFSLTDLPVPLVFATHRQIADCNPQFAGLFGYAPQELIGTGFHLLYPKFDDFIRAGQMWKKNLAGGTVYYDERIMKRRDDTRFWSRVLGKSLNPADPFSSAVYCFEPMNRRTHAGTLALTDRQLQIITLVTQGKTNRIIAEETGLSRRTVEGHRLRIMREIGVKNAAELAAWFQQR